MTKVPAGDGARKPSEPAGVQAVIDWLISEPEQPDERYFLEDITRLDTEELLLERDRLRDALVLMARPRQWAVERLARIRHELEVRGAN